MKVSLLLWLPAGAVIAALAGCAGPAATGGDVTFSVYLARPSESTLLCPVLGVDGVKSALVARSLPIARCVVVPRYEGPDDPPYFPAQVVTLEKNVVTYPMRLHLATWDGREHPPWETSPKSRSFMYAWVFADGAWPVYAEESISTRHDLMSADIRTRWGGWTDIASTLEGEASIVCFPLSRPWDREVAASAGCRVFTYSLESGTVPSQVGGVTTLDALSAVPCWIIGAVEGAKALTNADRLMVYRHVLRIYKETKAHWMDDEPTGYGVTRREAYDQNVVLLRRRIKAVETKANDFTRANCREPASQRDQSRKHAAIPASEPAPGSNGSEIATAHNAPPGTPPAMPGGP